MGDVMFYYLIKYNISKRTLVRYCIFIEIHILLGEAKSEKLKFSCKKINLYFLQYILEKLSITWKFFKITLNI